MRTRIGCATLALAALSAALHAQRPAVDGVATPSSRLSADAVVERRGASGDRHAYVLDLHAGTFVEISASQEAAELRLTLVDPDDAEILAIDLPSLEPWPERLLFVAARPGGHRLDVTLTGRGALQGREHEYTIRVHAWRPATDRDRRRLRCFSATGHANQLARRPKPGIADLGAAIDAMKAATHCWQAEADADLEMATLASLAGLSALFSDFRLDSAAAHERLVAMLRAAGQARLELRYLDALTLEYNDDGRHDRCRDTAIEMQRLAATLGERRHEGLAFRRLAVAEFGLGNYESARKAAVEALEIARAVRDAGTLGVSHLLLGRIDELAGDYVAALVRYEEGLRASAGDRFASLSLTNALGFLHLRRGEHDAAASRFEARLAMAASYVQRDSEALARVGLGDVRLARGDREGAGQLYAAAAESLQRGMPGIRCIAIHRLGRHALAEHRLDDAAAHFAEMLAINQQLRNPPCEAEARAGIADVALARGELEAADAAARQVIDIVEQFREAAPSLESRALGFGALAPAFERAVDISMRRAARGDAAAAARGLVLNERALARALLDRLSELAWDEPDAVSDARTAERRRVREQWRVRVAQFQAASLTARDRDRAQVLQKEMTALELQLRDLDAAHAGPRPAGGPAGTDVDVVRRARLIRPTPIDPEGIQALLDDDTTLVEYALGERRSHLWVVTPRGMRALELAPRAEIESAALAVYRDLAASAGAARPGAEERRRTLARLVLAPAAPALAGRRLVVVATGALSLVPFAALPLEDGAAGAPTLLSRFEVVHVPSATTLATTRALAERRPRPTRPTSRPPCPASRSSWSGSRWGLEIARHAEKHEKRHALNKPYLSSLVPDISRFNNAIAHS